MGLVNQIDDAGEAFDEIKLELEKLPNYSFIEAHRSSRLRIATLFKIKFVDKSSWPENENNLKHYNTLVKLINRKFGNKPVKPVAATSGGAARDSPSVWSWFWIAQGLAVVVVLSCQ